MEGGTSMNANELADELENKPLAYGDDIQEWLGEAATMLRQQQAEIEALKYEKSSGAYQGKYLEQYWVTQQSDEPVAWMGNDYDGMKRELYFEEERNKLPYRLYETAIPLYTHPAKTLTDEEIDAVGDEVSNLIDTYAGRREFARAILRKAQEK